MNHKWENAFTLDKQSWGFRRNMKLSEILTINELLETVVSTVSCGGKGAILLRTELMLLPLVFRNIFLFYY